MNSTRTLLNATKARVRTTVVIIVVATLPVIAGITLWSAGARLQSGQSAAGTAREALARGDLEAAREALVEARQDFAVGHQRLGSPLLRILDALPVVGHNLVATRAAAEAGVLMSEAGEQVLAHEAIGGPAALAPEGGRIPLDRLHAAVRPVAGASERVRQAVELIEAADNAWLVGPVAQAVRDLRAEARSAMRLANVVGALTHHLPAFLGAEGPRRYFFGAGNPAELRGAGGFIGAYAILTVEDGRLSFGPFAPTQELSTLPVPAIDPPNADYAARYDRYGGAGFWHNINMTPDFPSAATAIERLYKRTEGESLDGTIVATPAALAALLKVTGPAEVPDVGIVDADRIVQLMANEAFGAFADDDERKRALGAVAASVFDRFLHGAHRDPVAAGRALAEAAAEGHLVAHATDPAVQDALTRAGVAGELPPPRGDFVAGVGNNAAANKVDFYTSRRANYDVRLRRGGSAVSQARIHLRNVAPTTGQPKHVIGPNAEGLAAGDNATIFSLYCPPSCVLQEFRRDGETGFVTPETELSYRVYSTSVRLSSGETSQLAYRWTSSDIWDPPGPDGIGVYRLTVRDQATIHPTEWEVSVTVPHGLEVISTLPQMSRRGRRLFWSGEVGATLQFEIRLRQPTGELAVDRLRTWVNRPVLVNMPQ